MICYLRADKVVQGLSCPLQAAVDKYVAKRRNHGPGFVPHPYILMLQQREPFCTPVPERPGPHEPWYRLNALALDPGTHATSANSNHQSFTSANCRSTSSSISGANYVFAFLDTASHSTFLCYRVRDTAYLRNVPTAYDGSFTTTFPHVGRCYNNSGHGWTREPIR
jgi:hypothetical protein